MKLRAILLLLLLGSSPAWAAGRWNMTSIGPGGAATFDWTASDAGDAQPALDARLCATLGFTVEVPSGTPSVAFYPVSQNAAAPATSNSATYTATATARLPTTLDWGPYFLDPDVDTAGAAGGSVTVRCTGFAQRGSGGGAGVVARSYGALKACLESPRIAECVVDRWIVLPPGANNVVTWRTGETANGAQAKAIRCAEGGWLGTDDAVVDTASFIWDWGQLAHDAELRIEGCGIDGAPTDGDTYGIDIRGSAIANLLRVYWLRNHFSDRGTASTRVHFDSLIGLSGMWIDKNMFDALAGTIGHQFVFDGGFGGSAGQGSRIWLTDNIATPAVNFYGMLDLRLAQSAVQLHLISRGNVWSGGAVISGNSIMGAWYMLGGAISLPRVDLDDQFALGSNRQIPCIVSIDGVNAGGGVLSGRVVLGGANTSSDFGGVVCATDGGFGFESIDLDVVIQSTDSYPGDVFKLAFADTDATLYLKSLDLRVQRGGIPGGTTNPNPFDRTFWSKLYSDGTANGSISFNGARVPIMAGKIGSMAWGPMIVRSQTALSGTVDTALMTATMPSTIKRAACWTEDTTGSATFNLYRGTSATLLHSANQACGFRKTDAAATTCPTCTGGAGQTATLTSVPDDGSIICSSTTPATSFQISPTGECRNKTNITSCTKASGATTISWTPTSTVTANLSCTYDTVPAWVTMNQNTSFALGDVLGFRTTAGFANTPANARTWVMVESTPTN